MRAVICEKSIPAELVHVMKIFKSSDEYIRSVHRQLVQLNVEELIFDGSIELQGGIRVVGKGQNSVVIKCRLRNSDHDYVCKIRRLDSPRANLLHEANVLRRVNRFDIGPKLIAYSNDVEIMEYVRGEILKDWISRRPDRDEVSNVVSNIIMQAYTLDTIGVYHHELSRAHKHIIVTSDRKAKIIDFETCSLTSKSSNVTHVLNALVLGGSDVARYVRDVLRLSHHDIRSLMSLLTAYKRSRDYHSIVEIVRLLSTCGERL